MLFCLFTCLIYAQTNEKVTWDYPVRYGTPEWKNMKTVEEQFSAYNIPVEILKTISTKELVKVCLAYPEWGLLTAYDDRITGLSALTRLFNGFRELFKRDDAATELLKAYNQLDPLSVDPDWTPLQQGLYGFEIVKVEMFFNTNRIIDKLDEDGVRDLKEATVLKYQKKKMLPEIYSTWDLSPTAGIGEKIIRKVNGGFLNEKTGMLSFNESIRSNDDLFLDSIVELLTKIKL